MGGHEGGEGKEGVHHRSRGGYEGNEGHEGGEGEEGIQHRSRGSYEGNEGHESDEGVAPFLHVPADGLLQAKIVTLGAVQFSPCRAPGTGPCIGEAANSAATERAGTEGVKCCSVFLQK